MATNQRITPKKAETITPNQRDQILIAERQVDELTALYASRQASLQTRLAGINLTEFQRFRTEELLRQINQEIRFLNEQTTKWAEGAIDVSYFNGVALSRDRLKALAVTDSVNTGALIHRAAVDILTQQTATDLLSANRSIQRNLTRFVRRTQQQLVQDKAISQMIAEGIIEGESRRVTSDRILNNLRAQMGQSKFITINGRNFEPKTYAELLARTRTREAVTQGSVNTALQHRIDLVQISVHSTSCVVCMPFQGKIFSISGNDDDFPTLVDLPPFHPNCKHVALPVTRAALRVKEELGESISHSTDGRNVRTMDEFRRRMEGESINQLEIKKALDEQDEEQAEAQKKKAKRQRRKAAIARERLVNV